MENWDGSLVDDEQDLYGDFCTCNGLSCEICRDDDYPDDYPTILADELVLPNNCLLGADCLMTGLHTEDECYSTQDAINEGWH